MSEVKNNMNWSITIVGVVFCILAGIGAGSSVQNVLHAKPGWVLPVYAVVTGVFTGLGALVLLTILSSLKKD